jgi:glycosyltransferase involved in cell wall biosynthesis
MTRPSPLVTINIPTFNQERYVACAIESALAQDYPNLQVVVCDDASSDRTYEVAASFHDPRLRVHRNQANLGRVGNYRHALYELAQGEWVVNLDGDDYYDDPTFISEAIEKSGSDPAIVMYAAGSRAVNEQTGEISTAPMEFEGSQLCMDGVDYVLGYPKLGATQHFAVLYRRGLALETDFYSLDSLGTDTDSLCRLALKGKVFVHRKYVGIWRHHESNASYGLTEETVGKEVRMLEHIAGALAGHVPAAVAQGWLEDRLRDKRRLVENIMLAKLPTAQAWPYLMERWSPDLFHLRETVKLVLRTIGLRKAH